MRIINDDCLNVMSTMSDNSIDLLLTDIPYGGVNRKSNGLRNLNKGDADTFTMDLNNLVREMVRVTKKSGYIFCGWTQISEIISIIQELKLSNRIIVWEKSNPSPMNGTKIWLSGAEFAVYFKKKNGTYNQHCKNVVVKFPSGRGKVHPTEKPLKLFKHFIEISSDKGDVVFDPFLGSGTTAVACRDLERECVGVELNSEYIDIINNRLSN